MRSMYNIGRRLMPLVHQHMPNAPKEVHIYLSPGRVVDPCDLRRVRIPVEMVHGNVHRKARV